VCPGDAYYLHERSDIVGEERGGIFALGLVARAGAAEIE
jgi:hypothetical protein